MIHHVKNGRLDQLRLQDRGYHLDDGLVREHDGSLRDGVDIARKMKAAQVLQEVFLKDPQAPEIFNTLVREAQILDVLDDLIQSAGDGITVATGIFAVKRVKDGDTFLAFFEITLHHCQFVEVCQKREIPMFISHFH